MPLVSSKVAAGIEILADHFNKLREDLLTNHDHSAGKGGTVDHKDLSESDEMSGMTHQHNDIEVHLQGDGPGPNAIDNPGADQGVHGLGAAAFVAGSIDSNGVAAQLVMRAGVATLGSGNNRNVVVTLSPPFASVVSIVVTPRASAGKSGGADSDNFYISDVGTGSFTIRCISGVWDSHQVYWLAIGTI